MTKKKKDFVDKLLEFGEASAILLLLTFALAISVTLFLGIVVAWAWWEQIR